MSPERTGLSHNKFSPNAFNQVVIRSAVLSPILVLLVLTCAGCGARSNTAASAERSQPIAAKMGADVITVAEVDGLLAEARSIFRKRGRLFPAKTDPYYADLRDEAVRYLVERTLREQFAESIGIDVAASIGAGNLNADTYRAIAGSKREGETLGEALARNRTILEERFGQVRYSPGFRPAEHRRSSLPPELRRLPKPKPTCDLKRGAYPYFEARAHGCLGPGDNDVRYIAPPCPEIPAGEIDPGFTADEVDSGYAVYVTSGGTGHGFFEPLTTNREDLASEEDPEGPVCQAFPGDSMVSVGAVGDRSKPIPLSP